MNEYCKEIFREVGPLDIDKIIKYAGDWHVSFDSNIYEIRKKGSYYGQYNKITNKFEGVIRFDYGSSFRDGIAFKNYWQC